MGTIKRWGVGVVLFSMVVMAVQPAMGTGQPAAPRDTPVLFSMALPAHESPEAALPIGAVAYVRANNMQRLLEDLDDLLTSFVPEKALPPDFKEIFSGPHPFLAFLSARVFGESIGVTEASTRTGIALDRPAGLAFYPMEPARGFVLSVPISDAANLTTLVRDVLKPKLVEKVAFGGGHYLHVVVSNPELPTDLYILSSHSTAFFCGSARVAHLVLGARRKGTLDTDPAVAAAMDKYAHGDVVAAVSTGFLGSLVPILREGLSARRVKAATHAILERAVRDIPPVNRAIINARLIFQFGIDGIDQLADCVEAVVPALSQVLLEALERVVTEADGCAVGMDFSEAYQTASLAVFSAGIDPAARTRALPMGELKEALGRLPGEKHYVHALGRAPRSIGSGLLGSALEAVDEALKRERLPGAALSALRAYQEEKKPDESLEARVPWSLKTPVRTSDRTDLNRFATFEEWFRPWLTGMDFGSFTLVTLLPAVDKGLIDRYFEDAAGIAQSNRDAFRARFGEDAGAGSFWTMDRRFRKEDAGDHVHRFVEEEVYRTAAGLFGYQQHELINRRSTFYTGNNGYFFLYKGLDPSFMARVVGAEPHPVSDAMMRLLERAPEGANSVNMARSLHLFTRAVDFLADLETLIHRDLYEYLMNVRQILNLYQGQERMEKLLELKIPLPAMTLNVDAAGEPYCVLPGGFQFPRPRIMPEVKKLLEEYRAGESKTGGAAAFGAVRRGEMELCVVQDTRALGLLVRTAVNTFFARYLESPGGQERLASILAHPGDGKNMSHEDVVVINSTWKQILEPWMN